MRDRDDLTRDDQTRSGPGFNRRDFLKGSSAAVAATAIATGAQEGLAEQAVAKAVVPAAPVSVTLNVNGKDHTIKVEPRTTLVDALRNDLNLTGAKEVCTTTNCGSCTVLVDGKPILSCARLAIESQGKKITTVEALSSNGKIDDVIKAFVKHDATQCGFCTPGFVVATRAFLDAHPKATLEDIRKGLGGNLCRCGTYDNVAHAAHECAGGAKKGGQ